LSESVPGKSEAELATRAFVDSLMDIYQNLDREKLHEEISRCVEGAVAAADTSEESGEEADGEEE
jgi:hypothetical protein